MKRHRLMPQPRQRPNRRQRAQCSFPKAGAETARAPKVPNAPSAHPACPPRSPGEDDANVSPSASANEGGKHRRHPGVAAGRDTDTPHKGTDPAENAVERHNNADSDVPQPFTQCSRRRAMRVHGPPDFDTGKPAKMTRRAAASHGVCCPTALAEAGSDSHRGLPPPATLRLQAFSAS